MPSDTAIDHLPINSHCVTMQSSINNLELLLDYLSPAVLCQLQKPESREE